MWILDFVIVKNVRMVAYRKAVGVTLYVRGQCSSQENRLVNSSSQETYAIFFPFIILHLEIQFRYTGIHHVCLQKGG